LAPWWRVRVPADKWPVRERGMSLLAVLRLSLILGRGLWVAVAQHERLLPRRQRPLRAPLPGLPSHAPTRPVLEQDAFDDNVAVRIPIGPWRTFNAALAGAARAAQENTKEPE
jgi:hypothetical protein